MSFLSDFGSSTADLGKALGDFAGHGGHPWEVIQGMGQAVDGAWGGLGVMGGSFLGTNQEMPGMRMAWLPLLSWAGGAMAGGSAAGGSAGTAPLGAGSAGAFDAGGMGTGVDAGVMSSDAGLSSMGSGASSPTPYWQRLLRNQGISQGIGLLSRNGGGQGGGNNTVSTPSSGFYQTQQTTQPQPMQQQQQPTLASQNQASNQQLGMGGLLRRRNQSGYGVYG